MSTRSRVEAIESYLAELEESLKDKIISIAGECLDSGIIDEVAYENLLSPNSTIKEKIKLLLTILCEKIEEDGLLFEVFMDILNKDRDLRKIGRKIRTKLREIEARQQIGETSTEPNDKEVAIVVPPLAQHPGMKKGKPNKNTNVTGHREYKLSSSGDNEMVQRLAYSKMDMQQLEAIIIDLQRQIEQVKNENHIIQAKDNHICRKMTLVEKELNDKDKKLHELEVKQQDLEYGTSVLKSRLAQAECKRYRTQVDNEALLKELKSSASEMERGERERESLKNQLCLLKAKYSKTKKRMKKLQSVDAKLSQAYYQLFDERESQVSTDNQLQQPQEENYKYLNIVMMLAAILVLSSKLSTKFI